MSFEEDTTETHERRIVRCRSCNAKIIWFVTDAGKRMPVDADTVEADDFDLEIGRHISHFATCPQGNRWRKPRLRIGLIPVALKLGRRRAGLNGERGSISVSSSPLGLPRRSG